LPVGLGALSSLTALDLGDNSFRGRLPCAALMKLRKLRAFRVRASLRNSCRLQREKRRKEKR
jgi:hypothetical protein